MYLTCKHSGPLHPLIRQVVLVPEEPEDMWHAYNLVALGDSVKSTTIRKVKDESVTGSSTANRVRTTLTLSVEKIEFDTSACELRVKGRNIQENQYVKVSGRVGGRGSHLPWEEGERERGGGRRETTLTYFSLAKVSCLILDEGKRGDVVRMDL